MSTHSLTTPADADVLIADLFRESQTCTVAVREDRAFKTEGWLNLGSIRVDGVSHSEETIVASVRRGGFEWDVSPEQEVEAALVTLLQLTDAEKLKSKSKLRRALDATAAAAMRAGLRHPRF